MGIISVIIIFICICVDNMVCANMSAMKMNPERKSIFSIKLALSFAIFNGIFNKAGKKLLGIEKPEFDVGTDALRTPFENLLKQEKLAKNLDDKATEALRKKLSAFKFGKVVASTLMAIAFVGFILPKIYQGITDKIMKKEYGRAIALPYFFVTSFACRGISFAPKPHSFKVGGMKYEKEIVGSFICRAYPWLVVCLSVYARRGAGWK